MARRDLEDANERPSIERKLAKIEGRLDRLSDGVGNINNVKADLEAECVVALRPNAAIEYWREVEALNRA